MKNIFLFVVLIITSSFAQAAPYKLINMGPEFKQYVTDYRNQTTEQQWQGWKSLEAKYSKYFNAGLCDASKPKCEAFKKSQLSLFFKTLPSFEDKMWALFDQATTIVEDQTARFKKTFPDLQEDIVVVFMPSLSFFNGQGVTLPNNSAALLVGVDMVVQRNDHINALFSHEFFHVYQFEKIKTKKIFQTINSTLWFEGLGTWVSIYLNSEISDAIAFMDEDLAKFCAVQTNVVALAKDFIGILAQQPLTEDKINTIDREWFTIAGDRKPYRQGYCLGTEVIREIAKTKTVHEMVTLGEDEFSPLIAEALEKIANR